MRTFSISRHLRPHRPSFFMALALWLLGIGIASAAPIEAPPQPLGTARVQYNQDFDDKTAAQFAKLLSADPTVRFRYEKDLPDDYRFPNGLTMGQAHAWLAQVIDAWNLQALMPFRIELDRNQTDALNVIRFDETGSEVGEGAGIGGYSYHWDVKGLTFDSYATISMLAGANTTREQFEEIAKHELGHALLLGHTPNRAAAMAYTTGYPDWDAHFGYYALDDLLGLRSAWARGAIGFGGLSGHLLYADGSPVGDGDVAALDNDTGEVLATALSDMKHGGAFRLELPAGRSVRLIAHPVQADCAVLGSNFLPADMVTPKAFAPTEMATTDRSNAFVVAGGSTQDLGSFTVSPPTDPPLLNQDAESIPLLPGERHHLSLAFGQLGADPPQVQCTLGSLSVENVTSTGNNVEFDVTAAPTATPGVSAVQVQSGAAANFQVGALWVRPLEGVVRATSIDPLLLTRGGTTELSVQGMGLDQVTGARVVEEGSGTALAAELAGAHPDGSLNLRVTAPDGTDEGPWDLVLQTADGDAPRAPEPLPRLWVDRGSLSVPAAVDGGDVPVGQPVEFSIPITNNSSAPYRVSYISARYWLGAMKDLTVTDAPTLQPGESGELRLSITPTGLGPTVVVLKSMADNQVDGVTELRVWGVPDGS
jgi:hypothetical protein